ncbi:hypothetical protein MNB_SV-4-754 [hydrothermal vent metagenome]|uniref:Uncharacterized protein n=1 Tax=hydrothermal vent metagenome TaxID=652676 RepID=A0A1W1E900_9ZZZZ
MELTQEQMEEIAKKETYIAKKEELLKQRKALLHDLEYAENDMEEGLIQEKREHLAKEIKILASKIRKIESFEVQTVS